MGKNKNKAKPEEIVPVEETVAVEEEAVEEEAVEEEAEAKPVATVAVGKSLTTNSGRGILADGDEIGPGDLAGGEKAFKSFVKSGHIVPAGK